MLNRELKQQIFESLPPRKATKFKYEGKSYSIYKGYSHLTNVSEALKTNHIAIVLEYATEKRSSKSATNYRLNTTQTDDGEEVIFGETVEGIIRIRLYCKEDRIAALDEIMDRFIDRIIEWYICELNKYVKIAPNTEPISVLQITREGAVFREIPLKIMYNREFIRHYDHIDRIILDPIEIESGSDGFTFILSE